METKSRINLLDRFASGMADIQIERNPLRKEVILILNEVYRDHYQDVVSREVSRHKKWAMVNKNVDLNYVQEMDITLVEDVDQIPWIVTMTITALPRVPRAEDQILVDGLKYTVSMVKPMNRQLQSVVLLMVYPERSTNDALTIYSVTRTTGFNGVKFLDVIWGGLPTHYSFDKEYWHEFESRIVVETFPETLFLKDKLGDIVEYVIPV